MSAVKAESFITTSIDEYLESELNSEIKHEYIESSVYAMAGASKNHESISANVLAEIRQHLKNTPCRPFGSDVKIKVGTHFFYPDMMVVCEDKTKHQYYTESPILIVEVLSKSTRRKDETTKRFAYQTLASLQEYVLIEQDIVDVEICRRSEGWIPYHYFLGDEAEFKSLELKLAVEEIYRWVNNQDMTEFMTR